MTSSLRAHTALPAPLALLACLLLMLTSRVLVAQDPTESVSQPAASTTDPEVSTKAPDDKRLRLEDYEMLIGPDGNPVPIRRDATLENFLKYREANKQSSVPEVASYDIGSIALEGTIEDDLARLSATFEVYVNVADEVVSVPLELREAILTDIEHSGAGDARPDTETNERGAGYRWWFRGRGKHTLKLSLLVRIRKLVGSRKLQLALPASAVSTLQLNIPRQGLKLSTANDAILKSKDLPEATEIQLFGLGSQLDLQWQPLPDRKTVETVLQADTSIEVEVIERSVILQASQRLRATQGSFEEITVKLPDGFEIRDIQGPLYSNHRDDPNAPNHVIVQLYEEAVDETVLEWTLLKELPGSEFTLDGFSVKGARQQTGEITIKRATGLRINELESDAVLRKSVNPGDEQTAAVAYRFLRQPFRLVLRIDEIEPWYTVQSKMFLHFAEDAVDLDAVYRFDVMADRGVVREVELLWPALASEDWEIAPSQFPTGIERVETDLSAGRIRYFLSQPSAGAFEVPLRARRALLDEDESIGVSLPLAEATRTLPTILVVAQDDNVDAALSPAAQTEMRALTAQQGLAANVPEIWQDAQPTAIQVVTGSHEFFAAVTVHERSIVASASVDVELQDGRFFVTQRTEYEVDYGRVSEVRLRVPQALTKEAQFFLSTLEQETLLAASKPIGLGALKETRLLLPEPHIGQFDIVTRFTLDLSENLIPGGESSTAIPVLQPAETDLSSVRLQFSGPDRVEAEAAGDAWQRQLTAQGADEWTSSDWVTEIPLVLSYPTRPLSQSYSVSKAVIRSWVDEAGSVKTRCQYRIDGQLTSIELSVPAGLQIDELWWNDVRLQDADAARVSEKYLLQIPDDSRTGSNLLTIDAHSKSGASSWSTDHQFAAPELLPDTWVHQSVWQIMLPIDQHLLTYPRGYTPLFRWQRSSLLWGRVTLPEYANLDSWISSEQGPPSSFDDLHANANDYVFGRIGAADQLAMRSMKLSMIVLFGASTAWVIGVILLRVSVPAARQTLTLLSVALCLSILSLRYSAQVQLLIQPAALGALLAVAAVFIDSYFKRRKPATILSVSSPSDFVAAPATMSSVDRVSALNAGLSEPPSTQSRQPQPPEPVSSSDSGSRI